MTSLDGRAFVARSNSASGQVGAGTVFHYREADGRVWADYAGGAVVRGFLIGTRTGDTLDFRYVHLDADGETATGHCRTRIDEAAELTLHETWEWESRPGSGTSVLVEVPALDRR